MTGRMANTLILFAHPALEKSRVNRALANGVASMEGITFHDLYEEYPDFHIDVEKEKSLLLDHQRIVLQHPFYWYSTPAILKEWFDVVLQYGWAYGKGGDALVGKSVKSVLTTGGSEKAYCAQGHNQYTVEEFLRPIEQTARLCGMHYEQPLIFYGALHLSDSELDATVDRYRETLQTD